VTDGRTSETGGAGDITHCEWCGAEFDTSPAPRPSRATPPSRPASPAPGPGEGETHCEWCGAEYPVPGAGG
jgi:hypothetical protein